MKKQIIILLSMVFMGYVSPVLSARAVEAPAIKGNVVSEGRVVADAEITLGSRYPEACKALTTKTNGKGQFSIGPLCEYQTKIPSISPYPTMFSYNLFIRIENNNYLWQVVSKGYAPFKQQVIIDISNKTVCDAKSKQCFDLYWQQITQSEKK